VGEIPDIVPKIIGANISAYMNLDTEILPPLGNPVYAYDKRRLQYNAGIILKQSDSADFYNGCEKVIAVLDVDIFVPIFTHVFGEARQGGKCALVSLFRLKEDSPPLPSLIYERAAKVALHELGHLFNLLHCEDSKCLMHFSGGLEHLDSTPLYFCRYCLKYFNEATDNINSIPNS